MAVVQPQCVPWSTSGVGPVNGSASFPIDSLQAFTVSGTLDPDEGSVTLTHNGAEVLILTPQSNGVLSPFTLVAPRGFMLPALSCLAVASPLASVPTEVWVEGLGNPGGEFLPRLNVYTDSWTQAAGTFGQRTSDRPSSIALVSGYMPGGGGGWNTVVLGSGSYYSSWPKGGVGPYMKEPTVVRAADNTLLPLVRVEMQAGVAPTTTAFAWMSPL